MLPTSKGRNVYNELKVVYLTKRWPGWFITRQSVTKCNDLPDWNPFHSVMAQKQYWLSPLTETGQASQLNVKRPSVKHSANWTSSVQFSNWHFVNSSEAKPISSPLFLLLCYHNQYENQRDISKKKKKNFRRINYFRTYLYVCLYMKTNVLLFLFCYKGKTEAEVSLGSWSLYCIIYLYDIDIIWSRLCSRQ